MASITLPFPPTLYARMQSREHLTHAEVEKRIKTTGSNRHGHRDSTMISVAELNRGGAASVLVYSDPMKLAAKQAARLGLALLARMAGLLLVLAFVRGIRVAIKPIGQFTYPNVDLTRRDPIPAILAAPE